MTPVRWFERPSMSGRFMRFIAAADAAPAVVAVAIVVAPFAAVEHLARAVWRRRSMWRLSYRGGVS